MRRRIEAVVLCLCLFTVLAATAEAKELRAVKVCGVDRCVEVPRAQLSIHLLEGGYRTSAPDHAEPYYRVRFRIGGGGAHDTFSLRLLPRAGYLGGFEDSAGSGYDWVALGDRQVKTYRRLTRTLKPFPQAVSTAASAPERAAPSDDPQGSNDGVAVAGLVAGAALVGLAGLSLRRRRARGVERG